MYKKQSISDYRTDFVQNPTPPITEVAFCFFLTTTCSKMK